MSGSNKRHIPFSWDLQVIWSCCRSVNCTENHINSCYYSWACRQSFLCLRLHSDEAYGSIQWKMTHKPRLHVKTADNSDKSYWNLHCLISLGFCHLQCDTILCLYNGSVRKRAFSPISNMLSPLSVVLKDVIVINWYPYSSAVLISKSWEFVLFLYLKMTCLFLASRSFLSFSAMSSSVSSISKPTLSLTAACMEGISTPPMPKFTRRFVLRTPPATELTPLLSSPNERNIVIQQEAEHWGFCRHNTILWINTAR